MEVLEVKLLDEDLEDYILQLTQVCYEQYAIFADLEAWYIDTTVSPFEDVNNR